MKDIVMQAKNLGKIYKGDRESFEVLKQVNIEIYKGDFAVIMGSSGSGKSTLLYLLSGMDSCTTGEVILNDTCISNLSEKKMSQHRRKNMGFVFQGINLVPNLTLLENVVVPGYLLNKNKAQVDKKALELLELVELKEQVNKYPSQVSGGQQQRAAIVRGLINSPDVLFADEPTGALNSSQGNNILDILTDLNKKGQTVVMVTHDIKAAIRANRLIFISDGNIKDELKLGYYAKEMKEEREKKAFSYLTKMGW